MLHPHPDGQGFQLDVHLLSMQLFEDVPRRMSGRQNNLIAPVDAAILHAHALNRVPLHQKLRYSRVEMHLPAVGKNTFAHIRDDAGQLVRANMGMRLH